MKKLSKYYWLYIFLIVIYMVSFFVEVPNPAVLDQYDIPREAVLWINMTGAIPLLLIWFAGFYAFVRLRNYAKKIIHDDDGQGFKYLAAGTGALAIGLVLSSVVSRWLVNAFNAGMVDRPTVTIIESHVGVAVPLISFLLLAIGAYKLFKTLDGVHVETWRIVTGSTILAIIAISYLVSVFATSNSQYPTAAGDPGLYMPDWLVLATIALPYIASLACATATAILIRVYTVHTAGRIYKKSMTKLNRGFIILLVAISMIQFIVALNSMFTDWGFVSILGLIYLIILVMTFGFVSLARGAKGLTKIEDATNV